MFSFIKLRGVFMLFSAKQFMFFVLMFSCSVAFAQTSSDDLIVWIKKDAPDVWRDYFRSWNNTKVEYTEIITEKNVQIEDNLCSMFLSYPCMEHRKLDNINHKERLVVFNRHYRFSLERKQENEDWGIDYIEPIYDFLPFEKLDFPILFEKNNVSVELFIGNIFARGFMFSLGDWFPVIFSQPEFHILEAKEVVENNEKLIWIRYDYNPPQRSNQLLRGGEVFLMPNRFWLIKRADVRLLEPDETMVNATISCEYDFYFDAIPCLKSHSMFIKEYNYTFKRTFTNYQIVENASIKNFTLSNYGFPEPDFDNSRHTNRVRYILMGLGVIMIGIALWRMYKKRHEHTN
jgi:hypothetical protein